MPACVHASVRSELDEVAKRIVVSKSFDFGTACVAKQAVIVDAGIARSLRNEMKLRGAYFCTSVEAGRLSQILLERDGSPLVANIGQAAPRLAARAGFSVPPRTRVLVGESAGIGRKHPLSAEKRNPVLAWYSCRTAGWGSTSPSESCASGASATAQWYMPTTPKWSPCSAAFRSAGC